MKKVMSIMVTLITFFVFSGCMGHVQPWHKEYKHTRKGQADFKITKFEVPYYNLYFHAPVEVPVYIEWNNPTPTHLRLTVEYNTARGLGNMPYYELWDKSSYFGSNYLVFDTGDIRITNQYSTHIEETFTFYYTGKYKMSIMLWNKYHRRFNVKHFEINE